MPGEARGDDDDVATALTDPAVYPWRPPAVEVIETHLSWVVLAGERVVKVARPVHFGFVDHSTLERRRHSREEEVRLNRRLTDGVYLGVAPIVRDGDRLTIADGTWAGPAVEWATLMRRLPAARMLDRLLAAGDAPADLVGRLADRLIPFHRDLAARCDAAPYGSAAALAAVLTDNLDELDPFSGARLGARQLALVDSAIRSLLADRASLLAGRVAGGWIRDGHGDLRAEHICLEEHGAVQIFDCVEFNAAIRCADIASDLAFLLMDLDRLGAAGAARDLEERYRAAGIDLPPSLVRLYRAHRALVRAKVACLTLANQHQPHPGLGDEARGYLDLATRASVGFRPCVAAFTGLSGTGKSTVARALANATGAAHHASDLIRKELAAAAGWAGDAEGAWQAGLYNRSRSDQTYERLFARAAATVAAGQPVILDAAFLDNDRRRDAATLADRLGVPLLLIETVCPEEIALARLAARTARGDSPSDATAETYFAQLRAIARTPLTIPPGAIAVTVDTTGDKPGLLDPILGALAAHGLTYPRV